MSEYYLIKKSDVDTHFTNFPEEFKKLTNDYDKGKWFVFKLFTEEISKLIDLSDERFNIGDDKTVEFVKSRNYKEENKYSPIGESYIAYKSGYSQALNDLK